MNGRIPEFGSEDEEREFWAEHDSTEYVDWSRARRTVLPNLRPATRPRHPSPPLLLVNPFDVIFVEVKKAILYGTARA
jgi:hypothetical protein